MDKEICGIISNSGVDYAPLACAYKPDHDGEHSWANLPTFGKQDPATELVVIHKLIEKHHNKQSIHRGFGSHAERVEAILREYEEKTIGALSNTKQFRDDMLTFFRALALVVDMTLHASTHKEKDARLRGMSDLLESNIENLRQTDINFLFSTFRWRDVFRSDWTTRQLKERIWELESQIEQNKPPVATDDFTDTESLPL